MLLGAYLFTSSPIAALLLLGRLFGIHLQADWTTLTYLTWKIGSV